MKKEKKERKDEGVEETPPYKKEYTLPLTPRWLAQLDWHGVTAVRES